MYGLCLATTPVVAQKITKETRVKKTILGLSLLFVCGAFASEPAHQFGIVDSSLENNATQELTVDESAKIEESFNTAPNNWYFLGCGRFTNTCRRAAMYYGYNYWAAVSQPWRCGNYHWACFGAY